MPQISNVIGQTKGNKGTARAPWTSEQFRAVLGKTTSWKYHSCCFDNNLDKQQYICNPLYLLQQCSLQPIVSYCDKKGTS